MTGEGECRHCGVPIWSYPARWGTGRVYSHRDAVTGASYQFCSGEERSGPEAEPATEEVVAASETPTITTRAALRGRPEQSTTEPADPADDPPNTLF